MTKSIQMMLIDILMTLLSVVLMGGTLLFFDERVHQVLGMLMLVLWILHVVLHRRWYSSIFRGRYVPYRIMQTVVNVGISVCAFFVVLGGLMMAWFMPVHFNMRTALSIHLVYSHWYYLFMCAHVGMHLDMIFSHLCGKKPTETSAKAKGVLLAKRIALALVCGYGVYAFILRRVPLYLFLRQRFFFLDLERGYILFAVDYISILVLFASLAHYLGKILRRRAREK
ncbi:MAG: endonuclease [Treponema sp.]|nr:endonuclease [Treponema sp.]